MQDQDGQNNNIIICHEDNIYCWSLVCFIPKLITGYLPRM